MAMVVILVMWPGPFEQTFVPPSHGDSVWNFASVGPVVSEMFKGCGGRTAEIYLSYKLTNERELKSTWKNSIQVVTPLVIIFTLTGWNNLAACESLTPRY